ncbi:hypothetical protein AZE42_11109 [Rhizopogon vesiculosus]|uniref:DUF6535 domain-containing protein n=1 Tax=Rhizopogon vesiculosus TaxID=180088 RepID=A0A1J8QK54_9AGAM|nr:hypothetical protein AZE42_11109 [Rhizopogon vesiculosus]
MSTQNMQSVSPPCPTGPPPTDDIDHLTTLNENGAKCHPTSEQPTVVFERGVAENMLKTMAEMLDVLRGSTIAEERGKDVESQFWATYKKISNEHDNDFLERANDDMGIILTFAGLFSAVNSTFIVGMQPNPGDTTNALMLQLINAVVNGPDAVNISDLSSSTTYASSTVWTQTISYASLSFSVLAAFGAVMGKQWLNSYKAARGRGSLEERGMQRQRKVDGLEYWHLQTVLGAFFILLQISLFLFGLSISANMWFQQTTISSIIMSTTAFGILFYVFTALVSVLRPDSPFRTPGAALLESVYNTFCPPRSTLHPNSFIKSSAIRWALETSTNPEVVAAAAAMVPRVQWPKLDASTIYARLLDNFTACLDDRSELFVTYGKAMAHLRAQSVKIDSDYWKEYDAWRAWGDKSRFIRDAFTDGCLAYDRLNETKDEAAQRRCKADARTALRTMVVYGMESRLSHPDDEQLIWEGNLEWYRDGLAPQSEEFNWLVDYLAVKVNDNKDDETKGDALLALSAMHGLGNSAKQLSYIQSLIHCMDTRSPRVRHAAVRAISDAREELSSIDSDLMPQGVDAGLLDKLSHALLTAIRLNDTGGPDVPFRTSRDRCYLRLIFALAKSDKWRQRLASSGHVERCISLLDTVLPSSVDLNFYLAGIFARIDPLAQDPRFSPDVKRLQTLMRNAWDEAAKLCRIEECVEALPVLVTATRKSFLGVDNDLSSEELANLTRYVSWVLEKLLRKRGETVSVVLPSVQNLRDDLRRKVEDTRTPAATIDF